MAVAAEVVSIISKTGAKGITRVRCKATDSGRTKVLIRNVLGPVKVGDIIMMRKGEMEAASAIQ